MLLPIGFDGSFRPTGVVGGPKLGAFERAAALFATGVLGDDALKKTPSSDEDSEKSAKCAVGLGGFDGGLNPWH